MAYESYTASEAGGINQLLKQRQQGVDASRLNYNNSMEQVSNGSYSADGGASYQNKVIAASGDLNSQIQEQQRLKEMSVADPWGFYRASAADNLAGFSSKGDPSDIFRSKLTSMVDGEFSPDDPSYKWRYEQGQQAVERSLASKGLLNSGNAALELQKYGQGMASQEYDAQFKRLLGGMEGVSNQFNSQFNRLATLAGVNLDPLGAAKVNSSNYATSAGLQASLANTGENARQWNDQMSMARQYEAGVQQGLTADYGSYSGGN